MPDPANSVLVVVASPGDAVQERVAIRDVLNDWNLKHGRRQGVIVLPWLYERHAVPSMGGRPQTLINSQAVDVADIVVAIFDARLGSSTGVDVSGTAEEIHRGMSSGKPVHVYFSQESLPRDVDLDQLRALRTFQTELQQAGLLGHYADPTDLAGQVEYAVVQDIADHGWSSLRPTSRFGAHLRWRHDHDRELTGYDPKGNAKYRTVTNQLVVTNDSDVKVEDLTFEISSDQDGAFQFQSSVDPVMLHPHSEFQWHVIALRHAVLTVSAQWIEDKIPRVGSWTVTIR